VNRGAQKCMKASSGEREGGEEALHFFTEPKNI
jgi:hypothetical protein